MNAYIYDVEYNTIQCNWISEYNTYEIKAPTLYEHRETIEYLKHCYGYIYLYSDVS